jgi:soluble lytic murein transglycosylase-like protein
VRRWVVAMTAEGRTLDMDAFIDEIPFEETQRYVRRVLEMEATYRLLYEGELPRWPKTVSGNVARRIDF